MNKEKTVEWATAFMKGCIPYIDKLIESINQEKGNSTEYGLTIDATVGSYDAILGVAYANNTYVGFIDTEHKLCDVLNRLIQHYVNSNYNV